MEILNFKSVTNFKEGQTYSVVLRGARKLEEHEFDLCLNSPNEENVKLAQIESQKQFVFSDLTPLDLLDNYDESIKSIAHLIQAMDKIYDDFDTREIITLLKFKVV